MVFFAAPHFRETRHVLHFNQRFCLKSSSFLLVKVGLSNALPTTPGFVPSVNNAVCRELSLLMRRYTSESLVCRAFPIDLWKLGKHFQGAIHPHCASERIEYFKRNVRSYINQIAFCRKIAFVKDRLKGTDQTRESKTTGQRRIYRRS